MSPQPLRRLAALSATLFAVTQASIPARAQDFTSPRLEAVTSWIGNSYGGGSKWVQQDIHAMAVTADGTVFTNVPWDEGGGNAGEYRDGELIRYGLRTHGWGNNGGDAVAVNSKYVFLGMRVTNEGGKLVDPETWPPKGSMWLGISRRLRADISQGAPFEGGKGGKGNTLKASFLPVAEVPDKTPGEFPGICADEKHLYVADPSAQELKIYDAETMQLLTRWKVERTGQLALDREGSVWMLNRRDGSMAAVIAQFDLQRKAAVSSTLFLSDVSPVAFCFASDGRMLVADDGPAQHVRVYTLEKQVGLSGGLPDVARRLHETGSFGEKGGIASGISGQFADRKFNRVSAIGCDAKDNLYVAHDGQSGGGGTVLESYRLQDGALNWRLFGLTFVDMADVDAANDTDVFTKEERFRLDYTQPTGKEAVYTGFTIGREKYPQDPRLHIWSGGAWVRQIGGKRILFVNDMNGDQLQVYRFAPETDGEVAIPSGFFAKRAVKGKGDWPPHQPEKGEWIWRDANGNGAFDADEFQSSAVGTDAPASQGWWVDRAGNAWLATEKSGLRFYPFDGLDRQGNPKWNFASMKTFPQPGELREVKRLRYDSATDTMVLGGTSEQDRNQHWKPMGPVLVCYDGWFRGERKLRWRVTLPYAHGASGHESCEPMGFDVAGDFIFVPYTGASKTNGVKTGRVEIFRTRDGSAVGHVEPGPEVGEVGLQDLRETLTAHRRADGEYVVLLEDDYKSKVVMYRLKGLR